MFDFLQNYKNIATTLGLLAKKTAETCENYMQVNIQGHKYTFSTADVQLILLTLTLKLKTVSWQFETEKPLINIY